jgi:hypothetical protein
MTRPICEQIEVEHYRNGSKGFRVLTGKEPAPVENPCGEVVLPVTIKPRAGTKLKFKSGGLTKSIQDFAKRLKALANSGSGTAYHNVVGPMGYVDVVFVGSTMEYANMSRGACYNAHMILGRGPDWKVYKDKTGTFGQGGTWP